MFLNLKDIYNYENKFVYKIGFFCIDSKYINYKESFIWSIYFLRGLKIILLGKL